MLSDLLFRVRSLIRRKTMEADLEDELRFHREQQLQKYLNSGLSAAEACRRVATDFGGLEQVKEECRDARGVRIAETIWQDLRYAVRVLGKSPGFTIVTVLTLALGIGANTAIFSVLYGILLRPLPYQDPSRLIVLNETTPKVGMVAVSYPNFRDWQTQSRAFSALATVNSVSFNLAGVNQPENINGEAVSPNFLSLLAVHPLLGRDFDPSEEKPGSAPVVLLSYPLWQAHFGGDPSAVGRSITLDGHSFVIIGVLPPDFRWIEKTDILEPVGVWAAANKGAYSERGERGDLVVLGRLAPKTTLTEARLEMEGIAARLAKDYPGPNDEFGVALRPVRDVFVSEIHRAVMVLFAAVMFVLLIACANVASLFLVRGTGRVREIALRMALGATRGRIVAQMLAESLILTSAGGAGGLALAVLAIRTLASLIPADKLAGASIDLNGPALLFAGFVVLLSAFVFGLAPAWHSTNADVQSELKEGGRSASAGLGPSRWRGFLVTAEIALALVLLAGAGLMAQSLHRLLSVDAGFRPEHVLTMQMSLRTAQYDRDPVIQNFWDTLLSRVRELPDVQSAALGIGVPLTGDHSRTDITVQGMALPKPGSFPHPDVHIVSPDFIRAMGIPLVRGREFDDRDKDKAPRVALVNARLARELLGEGNPIGRRVMFGHPSPKNTPEWMSIVGVVGDTKLYGLENPSRFEIYVSSHQFVVKSMTLVVKSAHDPAALASHIRSVIAGIDKDQPVFAIATMRELVRDSTSTRRITLMVLGCFSGLALVLAAIGIYGVISYSVAQRAHEIGIRMALGARPGNVLAIVLRQGARITGMGVLLGLGASLGLTRLLGSLLFSVSFADPLTFAGVTIVLALVAMMACYIPARRTLKIDPMSALRCE